MEIRKRLRAFTLVELLIVITIIGILAVALVPRITGAPAKARDAARVADLQQIATGLELYMDERGEYPDGVDGCVSGLDLSSYMTSVPDDPSGLGAAGCLTGYAYGEIDVFNDGVNEGYIIMADLENTTVNTDKFELLDVAVVETTAATTQLVECSSDCAAAIAR